VGELYAELILSMVGANKSVKGFLRERSILKRLGFVCRELTRVS